ncbi:MAG TPA: dihydroorotase [Syntrophales bacterium]|nr:dihydroorotase [Syntrophales bacterium]HPQ07380.1 dihydroorotase [Syntrophales bacterium]
MRKNAAQRLILRGGRVVDPSQNLDEAADIVIDDGHIAAVGPEAAAKTSKGIVIDLHGLIVTPGLIDMHVHLREPGFEYKETIRTGSEAACAGGFTAVASMANTDPVNDNRSVTEFILRKAAEAGLVRVHPVAAVTAGMKGESLTEFWDLKRGGAVALSDDGRPVKNSAVMRRALEYAASLKMTVISHCEDPDLSGDGVMNESFVSTDLGLPGIPAAAEEIMVARDILLARYTDTPVHIAHVSTAGSVELIREAKKKGVKVTAETAPHYFTLTQEVLKDYDTNAKVNPPLRGPKDVEAVKEGLRDGTIDVIASDHAPHAVTDKEVEFEYAANGIVGLETSLGLSLRLVAEGVLTLSQLVAKMSVVPAVILGIPGGTLRPGSPADLTVIDTNLTWRVDPTVFRSRGRNTPFAGWELTGKTVLTVMGGRITYRDPSRWE